MIVMFHKPAQIDNMAMENTDAIHIITFSGADLFKILQNTYECEHNFYEIFEEFAHSY